MRKVRSRKSASILSAAIGAGMLMALGLVPSAWGANLLLNPSFENPNPPVPPGQESHTAAGYTFYPSTEAERAQFFANTGQWSVFQKIFEPVGGVYQPVQGVAAGTPYTLSGYEFAEANAAMAGAILDFKLTWENSAGNEVGASALFFNSSAVSTAGFAQMTLSTSNYSTVDPFTGLTTDAPNVPTGATGGFTLTSPIAPAGATQVLVSFDYRGPGASGPNLSTFLDDVDLEGIGSVPANAWGVNGSGDWNVGANWTNGTVPNGIGQEADLFAAITANHNIYSDTAITVGTLNFNNANTYVIDGAGSLTMQASSGSALVIVQQGTQEINLPTTIASNTVFNVSSGATLVIADPLTILSGKTITQTGTGTVNYESIITIQTGGGLAFANSTHAAALIMQGSASSSVATHAGNTPNVLELDSLSMGGSTNSWTTKLDLTNNDLIVHNGNLANLTNQAKQGLGGTAGLVSSTALADPKHLTAVGVIQNDNGSGTRLDASFGGVSGLSDTDLLAKYTYYGDTNLDGKVDGSDYSRTDNGYLHHLTGWFNGDFNYDGKVDGSDYTLLDNAFNSQGALISAQVASATAQIAGSSAVPEPTTIGLIAIGAASLLSRRRR